MKTRIATALALVAVFACVAIAAEPLPGVAALDKKLIEYGWDVPFTDYVRDHIRDMEKRPFDGLIFKLRGGGRVLVPKRMDEAKFAPDYQAAKAIEWNKFTDNFVIMWAASDQDWFNDEHWAAIEHNVRLVARAARLARCVGICFDHEPYGFNPWAYTRAAHRDTKSFDEYQAMVRRRGAQFVRALEAELPSPNILTFFQLSLFGRLLAPMPCEKRMAKLSQNGYALLPAFLNGMLDAASPGLRIIDGNEPAYYYTDSRQYFDEYHLVTQRARLLIDPKLWPKYRMQMQVGQALYIDQYFGLRTRKVLGHYMTQQERPLWFEHNVYWALYTTDRYVWCYSERMNWWKKKGVPPGCEQAIVSARAKLAKRKPLGFDLKPLVNNARDRQRAEIAKRLKQQTADIRRCPSKPKIDGALDDAAWKATKPLRAFVALAARNQKLKAKTQARVTYDADALYVAVRCQEPRPKAMRIIGTARDQDVWQGDDVEVMVAAPGGTMPFYHFMVNPKNVPWDGIHRKDGNYLGYNPKWQHAVRIGANAWTVEMAIPWAAMKMTMPKPGAKLRGNICRQRIPDRELSAWSPMANGFLEHDLFGAWVAR